MPVHEDITKGLLSELYVDTTQMSARELTAEAISALDILVETIHKGFRGDSCDLKAAKEDADYQVWSDSPGKACRNCWRYNAGTCSAVNGIINPDGSCELWEMSGSAAPSILEIIHVPVEVVPDEPDSLVEALDRLSSEGFAEIDWDAIANHYPDNGIRKQDSIEGSNSSQSLNNLSHCGELNDGNSSQSCDRNDAELVTSAPQEPKLNTPLHMLHWNGLDIGFHDQDERHGFIRDSHAEVLLGDHLDSDQIWQVRTDDAESYVIGVRSKQQAKKLFSSSSEQPIKGIARVQPKDLLSNRTDAEEEEDFPALGLQSLGLAFAPLLGDRIEAAYQVLLQSKTVEDFRARVPSLYEKFSRKNTEDALYQHLLLTNLRGREEIMELAQENQDD